MFMVIKKNHILLLGLAALCLCFLYIAAVPSAPVAAPVTQPDTIVIDAGHGGMDGGAVGSSGALEKDLNLKIANYLKALAQKDGLKVIMTRTEDVSLGSTDSTVIRKQKRADLEYRKKILNESGAAAFISIHMNQFEQSKYKGAQVFYANNDTSRQLGELVQESIKQGIGDGNQRVATKVPDSVYITKNTGATAVIVECGFLSNPDEEKLLQQTDYQQKMAQSIYNGVKQYLKKQKRMHGILKG